MTLVRVLVFHIFLNNHKPVDGAVKPHIFYTNLVINWLRSRAEERALWTRIINIRRPLNVLITKIYHGATNHLAWYLVAFHWWRARNILAHTFINRAFTWKNGISFALLRAVTGLLYTRVGVSEDRHKVSPKRWGYILTFTCFIHNLNVIDKRLTPVTEQILLMKHLFARVKLWINKEYCDSDS